MSTKSMPFSVLLAFSVLVAGCGGGTEERSSTTAETAPPSEATPAPSPMTALAGDAGMGMPGAGSTPATTMTNTQGDGVAATAELAALGTSGVAGKITFTEREGKVWVEARITGLTPGNHGFHIHEFGDCSAADGSSAGAHFNPAGAPHGGMDAAMPHHAGDLGNLTADASGNASLSASTGQFTLGAEPHSILGRSVVVHAKADDLTTQPSGDSGGRIACGIIRADAGETTPVTKPAP